MYQTAVRRHGDRTRTAESSAVIYHKIPHTYESELKTNTVLVARKSHDVTVYILSGEIRNYV